MPVRALVHGTFWLSSISSSFISFKDKTPFEQTKPECGAQLNSSLIVQILRQFDRLSPQRQ